MTTLKKIFMVIVPIALLLAACQKDEEFVIRNGQVGKITKDTKIKQLDSLFPNDSIVNLFAASNVNIPGVIQIYQKGGKKLLEITPSKYTEDGQNISYIEVLDERYKTEKGLSCKSTFKDFEKKYVISSIENMINNVMVSFQGYDFYIVISKDELPAELRFDNKSKIDKLQIPDDAKVKYFNVSW